VSRVIIYKGVLKPISRFVVATLLLMTILLGGCVMDDTLPTVYIISPIGGEYYAGLSVQEIKWFANDRNLGDKPITLSYSTDGGRHWIEISSNEKDDGIYYWGVPYIDNSTVRVKVEAKDVAGNINFSISSDDFSIDSTVPKIQNITIHDTTIDRSGVAIDGDDIEITAQVIDNSLFDDDSGRIYANLSLFGLESNRIADSFDGTVASWTIDNMIHKPLYLKIGYGKTPIQITAVDRANKSRSEKGYARVYPLKIGVVEFVQEDGVYGNLYCYYSNVSGCYRLQNLREYVTGEILEEHDFLEIFNNPDGQFFTNYNICYDDVPHSVYYLEDFFENEAKRYGFTHTDIFEIEVLGPFLLNQFPPKRNRTWDGGIGSFFDGEVQNRSIDLSSYDVVAFVYFHDQGLVHRDYHGFVSTVSGKKNAVYNCVSTSKVTEDYGIQGVAHELAHILGASDKYIAPCGNFMSCCTLPGGLPEPDKIPLYPQEKASLMCGSILLVEPGKGYGQAPGSLDQVAISPMTAEEIGWID